MQDPQYRVYALKRAFSVNGPAAVDRIELMELVDVLPGKDVCELLEYFAQRASAEAIDLVAHVAGHDLRSEIRNRALSIIARDPAERERHGGLFTAALEGHPSDFVSATAIKAVGGSNQELTFGLFKSFLTHRDSRVRANCVEGLRYRTVPGLRPILELLLDDPSPRVRAEAALSLWKSGSPVLLQMVSDAEDHRERLSYIRTLGRTGCDERVIDLLWQIYRGDDEEEAAAAAESLMELQPEDMIPRIVGMAVFGPSAFRKRLFDCCLDRDQNTVVSELISHVRELAASGTAHAKPLATAVALLRRTGEVGDVDLILSLVDHEDARVAANAIEALNVRASAPQVRAGLIRCLRLGTPRMRVNAAIALWKTGLVAAVSELKTMLDDDEPTVRAGAVYGLGSIGGLVASDAIVDMLADPAEGVRSMAARFLS